MMEKYVSPHADCIAMLAKKRQCIFALIHEIAAAEGFLVSMLDGNSSNDRECIIFNDERHSSSIRVICEISLCDFRGSALAAFVVRLWFAWLSRGWADGWLWLLGVDFFGVGLMGGFG